MKHSELFSAINRMLSASNRQVITVDQFLIITSVMQATGVINIHDGELVKQRLKYIQEKLKE